MVMESIPISRTMTKTEPKDWMPATKQSCMDMETQLCA